MRIPRISAVVVALAVAGGLPAAHALYVAPQLELVPIDRLVENLTKQAEDRPKDARVWFNLARAHAMAFAAKTEAVAVNKRHENHGAWFGHEPRFVPFTVRKTDDPAKQKAAATQLQLALAAYEKSLEVDPDFLAARLGHAWCLEQAGKKNEAIEEYRATIAQGWEQERKLERGELGGHYIVVEAGGYLAPLLDPDKDKAELAELEARAKKLQALPRMVTPIAVPLADHLTAAQIEDRAAAVAFDADGTGLPGRWTWIKPNAAWLVYDQRGTGTPNSGLQLFGNVTFWCFWDNGYQALRALDDTGDGQLTGAELRHLALWHDANANGVADHGEVRPLVAYEITALACDYHVDESHPDRIPFSAAGVTYHNGTTRPTWDVLLHPIAPSVTSSSPTRPAR